ncbi:MAG TPA: hypothetical protein VHC69_28855 [Polyangiaceae bacterium]|nr:hypothetical protein [Polyangiaceae bacterium]
MTATNQGVQKSEHRGLEGFDEGTQMPYRTPRGAVVGRKRGLHVAQVLAILLIIGLFVAIAFMARTSLG